MELLILKAQKSFFTLPENLIIEHSFWNKGVEYIAGIDEAGRGPLAGPVVAAAVVFEPYDFIEGVCDSKKLSPANRRIYFEKIIERVIAVGIGVINNITIDQINIRNASLLAMINAIHHLSLVPNYLLIDGRDMLNNNYSQEAIIKGDSKSFSISAASIVAKVVRDKIMENYHRVFPQYGFFNNKGYGTVFHREMIKIHGTCSIHREKFLRKIFEEMS
jgi:ribonuclease HII